jgi:hypothetical protein
MYLDPKSFAKKKRTDMDEEESGASIASNFIWAIALVIVVMIIVGALYYGDALSGKKKTEIDVNVSVPVR